MTSVRDILENLEQLAPTELKLGFDNVGLLAGREGTAVTRVLVSLDITSDVISEAKEIGAQLIVSHHPLFFSGLLSVTDGDLTGKKIIELVSSGISAICMHTNLDAAKGGVNDALAKAIFAEVLGVLNEEEQISRICELNETVPMIEFLAEVKTALGANGLRYCDAGRPVKRLGICGGSGGQDIELAYAAGCDTFLTADVKHHQFLLANELGMNLVDAGHFSTENVVVPVLVERIFAAFPELDVVVSARHCQPEQFYV